MARVRPRSKGTREGLELPSLKMLYGRLVRLSLNQSIPGSDGEDHSRSLGALLERCGIASNDRHNVGKILFKELESRFEMFGGAVSGADAVARLDGLTCALRCCMVFLTVADPIVVLKKTRLLLRMVGDLIYRAAKGDGNVSTSFENRTSHDHEAVPEDFGALLSILERERSVLCRPFVCAVLEVIADEVLKHRLLREYFIRAVAADCSRSSCLMRHFLGGDSGSLVEVISLRFILSISDEEACRNFLGRLGCGPCNDLRASELSLTSTLLLLLNPAMLSAPKMLQVNLILMVSEAIDVSMSFQNTTNNMALIGTSHLKAVEWSVSFYTRFVSTFLMDGHPIGRKDSSSVSGIFGRSSEPAFECRIQVQEVTRAKIDSLLVRLVSVWNLKQRNEVHEKSRSNLLAHSIVSIDQCRADESCKEDIMSILNSIVLGAYSDSISNTGLYVKDDSHPQDVYLLSAALKLMSRSMLAVIWCLRHGDANLVGLDDASFCRAYVFMVDFLKCFEHFNVSLPNQKKLYGIMMEKNLIGHKTTKWMLLHISGLLSLSFATGLDFLVENCVSVLVALMNLYVFEEGNVGAIRSLLVSESSSFSSQEPSNKPGGVSMGKKSCQNIASRIQEIQSRFLRSESHSPKDTNTETSSNSFFHECDRDSNEGKVKAKKTCNGKVFLDILLKNSNSFQYDDLVDFVECKEGKDYSKWFKDKKRHRKWKAQRMEVLRMKKRKMPRKLLTARKS